MYKCTYQNNRFCYIRFIFFLMSEVKKADKYSYLFWNKKNATRKWQFEDLIIKRLNQEGQGNLFHLELLNAVLREQHHRQSLVLQPTGQVQHK